MDKPEFDALSDTLEAPLQTRSRTRKGTEVGPPVTLNRYELREVLGVGGMGRVYRAHDREMKLEVALKTLHHLDAEQMLQLKSEFRALLGMSHRNLVELYELFVDGDNCFFTLELIEGETLDRYVLQNAEGRDFSDGGQQRERLGEVVRQLCAGLGYLHGAGKLHRDIKPPNILVSEDRVVILDFGLVTRFGVASDALAGPSMVGTLPYMPPEQLWGAEPTPANDCYALGVLLYELVTGHLPFDQDNPTDNLEAKQSYELAAPHELVPSLSEPISSIIIGLLDPDPATRATLTDVISAFEITGATSNDAGVGSAFVGRKRELCALHEYTENARAATCMITVDGESGVGKSALLGHFCERLEREGALVLRGRCHPNESIPHNAFDALVDSLSRHLEHHNPEQVRALRPRRVRALLQLFPVLRNVGPLRDDSQPGPTPEPRELRRQGFAALSELFGRLCLNQRVVLWLDDAQWGDRDSAALLRELVLSDDAPECLFVLSYRDRVSEHFPFLESLKEIVTTLPTQRHLHLGIEPLTPDAAALLARRLLGAAAPDERIEAIVREAGGSPFFLGELAHESGLDLLGDDRPSLSSLVTKRMQRFVKESETLLGVVAVAGGPLPRSVALEAASLGEHGRPLVHRLEKSSLLRLTKVDGAAAVEAYHHRIRETVLSRATPEMLRDYHRRLADTLEGTRDPDPEALMTHHLGANDIKRGAYWTVLAAERADQTLAFDRAAQRYRLALTQEYSPLPKAELYRRLGASQANAGRGAEAAASYEAAANQLADGESGRAFDLRLRSAEQYLRSGSFEKGQALLEDCLRLSNLKMPTSPAQAARISGSRRLWLLAKGLRPKLASSQENERVRQRLDALWTATTSLSMVSPVYADAFGVQHLGEALTDGGPSRLVRALAYEAVCEACVGGDWLLRRSKNIIEQAARLARETADPYDLAWVELAEGCCAWCRCDWEAAARHCDTASRIFVEQCQGAAWEQATAEVFRLSALTHAGKVAELQQRLPELLEDALDREDLFAANQYRLGQHSLLWLCRNEPAHALAHATQAEVASQHVQHHLQTYSYLVAAIPAQLYQGDAEQASERIETLWPKIKSSQTMRLAGARIELLHVRGRAALARASGHEGKERKRWLGLAEKQASRLMKERPPHARPWAHLLQAGIAHQRGNALQRTLYLTEASRHFSQVGMRLYEGISRYVGGDHDALAEFPVVDAVRLAGALAPGTLDR